MGKNNLITHSAYAERKKYNRKEYVAEAKFMLRDFEGSIEHAEFALRQPETQIWGNIILTTALVAAGNLDDAKSAAAELLRRRPDMTISLIRKSTFMPLSEKYSEPYLDGLREAGVPEE